MHWIPVGTPISYSPLYTDLHQLLLPLPAPTSLSAPGGSAEAPLLGLMQSQYALVHKLRILLTPPPPTYTLFTIISQGAWGERGGGGGGMIYQRVNSNAAIAFE